MTLVTLRPSLLVVAALALLSTAVASAGVVGVSVPVSQRQVKTGIVAQTCPPSVYYSCVSLKAGQSAVFQFDCPDCVSGTWTAYAVKAKKGLPTDKGTDNVQSVFGGFCGNLCTQLTITPTKCKSSNGKIRYVDEVSAGGQGGPYSWTIGIICQ
jgi:hypothetical protein